MITILGPLTLTHLEDYLRSLELELDDQQYQRLDVVSSPRVGTPHECVAVALRHGFDGDRSVLRPSSVPVA
jgi:hypothetical protein